MSEAEREKQKRQKWRRSSLRFLPGSRAFNRWFQSGIAAEARSRLQPFLKMEILGKEKTELMPKIRHFQNQLGASMLWQIAAGVIALMVIVATLSQWTSERPDIFRLSDALDKIPNPGNWLYTAGYCAVTLISAVLWVMLAVLPYPALSKAPYLAFRALMYGWPFAVLAGYAGLYFGFLKLAGGLPPASAYFGAAVLRGGFALVYVATWTLFCLIFAYSIIGPFEWRTRSMYPAAVIANALLDILRKLEEFPARWPDFDFRRSMLGKLEKAATCAETGLLEKLNANARQSNAELRKLTRRIATEFRGLKPWIITPKADTRDYFIGRIKADLVSVCREDWYALVEREKQPGDAPAEEEKRLPPLHYVLRTLRTLVSGTIPLGVFIAVTRAGVKIEEPMKTYVTVGVYVWAGICLLFVFDPLFVEKIKSIGKTAKTIKGLFGGGKGDKED